MLFIRHNDIRFVWNELMIAVHWVPCMCVCTCVNIILMPSKYMPKLLQFKRKKTSEEWKRIKKNPRKDFIQTKHQQKYVHWECRKIENIVIRRRYRTHSLRSTNAKIKRGTANNAQDKWTVINGKCLAYRVEMNRRALDWSVCFTHCNRYFIHCKMCTAASQIF